LVQEALDGRHKVDPSGQIIKLPVAGCPWKEHLAQLEEEQKLGDAVKFCMYEVCSHQRLLPSELVIVHRIQRAFSLPLLATLL